jgi:D-3-phosphoglycerate dehydrogenase
MADDAGRRPGRMLFSPPWDFNPALCEDYRAYAPTEFHEVWHHDQLPDIPDLEAWVCQAGQSFVIDRDVLERYPRLEVLVTASTGRDHVDVDAVTAAGVAFYSLLDDREGLEHIAASAEMTFHLLLNCLRKLEVCVGEIAAGRWRQNEPDMRGRELQGRSVGIVGLGRIGRRMARYCEAFGCSVAYYDPYVENGSMRRYPDLDALFAESDCVSINCSLTDETRGMIDERLLALLVPGAIFVNTARGEIVDDAGLARVLERRPDLRAGIDVLPGEVSGRQLESPLLAAFRRGQITLTPHIAGATVDSQSKAALISLGLVRRHYGGS